MIRKDLMCIHNEWGMEGGKSHLANDYTSPGNDTHSRAVQATGIFQDWIGNFVVSTHVGDKGFRI